MGALTKTLLSVRLFSEDEVEEKLHCFRSKHAKFSHAFVLVPWKGCVVAVTTTPNSLQQHSCRNRRMKVLVLM